MANFFKDMSILRRCRDSAFDRAWAVFSGTYGKDHIRQNFWVYDDLFHVFCRGKSSDRRIFQNCMDHGRSLFYQCIRNDSDIDYPGLCFNGDDNRQTAILFHSAGCFYLFLGADSFYILVSFTGMGDRTMEMVADLYRIKKYLWNREEKGIGNFVDSSADSVFFNIFSARGIVYIK